MSLSRPEPRSPASRPSASSSCWSSARCSCACGRMQVISGASYAAQAENNRIREVTHRRAARPDPRREGHARSSRTARRSPSSVAADRRAKDDAMLARLSHRCSTMPVDGHPAEDRVSTKLEALQPRVVALDVPCRGRRLHLASTRSSSPASRCRSCRSASTRTGTLAAHVLGYVGEISDDEMQRPGDAHGYAAGDIVGKAGVEQQYESVLQGEKGYQRLEVDARGPRAPRARAARARRRHATSSSRSTSTCSASPRRRSPNAFAEAQRQGFHEGERGRDRRHRRQDRRRRRDGERADVRPRQVPRAASARRSGSALNATESEYPAERPRGHVAVPAGVHVQGRHRPRGARRRASPRRAPTSTARARGGSPDTRTARRSGGRRSAGRRDGHGAVELHRRHRGELRQRLLRARLQVLRDAGREAAGVRPRRRARRARPGSTCPARWPGASPTPRGRRSLNETIAPEYAQWLPGDTVNMAIGQGDLLVTPLQLADAVRRRRRTAASVLQPHVLDRGHGRGRQGRRAAAPRRS